MNVMFQIFTDFARYRGRRRAGPDGSNPFGDLRAVVPIARLYGSKRGIPIDRYYIERFLTDHAHHIRGRVLEIGDNTYTLAFGGSRVSRSDVLHVDANNRNATFVGDLSRCEHIPDSLFDCMILTQTLHLIYEITPALAHVHRLLRPGGVLLATFPGLSQVSDANWGPGWCWGWSVAQARELLTSTFPHGRVSVEPWGNRLAAVAFLHGLVADELPGELLDAAGDGSALLIGAVAVRAEADGTS